VGIKKGRVGFLLQLHFQLQIIGYLTSEPSGFIVIVPDSN
jgi:hypothetical protein